MAQRLDCVAMPHFSPSATTLVRQLVRERGFDPSGFHAGMFGDGIGVCVKSPETAACYPADCWEDKFLQHLAAGFFGRLTQMAESRD